MIQVEYVKTQKFLPKIKPGTFKHQYTNLCANMLPVAIRKLHILCNIYVL